MKKTLAVVLCLMLAFSLVACGGAGGAEDTSAKLQEYSDQIPQETWDSMSVDGMNLEIEVRGNYLAYVGTFTIDIPESMVGTLQTSLDATKGTFEALNNQIVEEVPGFAGTIVEYYNNDGKLLASITVDK